MREPAPPYRGEPPHALWHVSEDAGIRSSEPRAHPRHDSPEPLVWAVDSRHLPIYWFPRECPRATFWAGSGTRWADVERFLDGERGRRLVRLRAARVVGYRVSGEPVEALELVPSDPALQCLAP